jgi:PKHD-type hydroxylase
MVWDDLFTPTELDALERHGDALMPQKAAIAAPTGDDDAVRITQVAWIANSPAAAPFYEKLAGAVQHLNSRFYRYDVTGLETLQYTVYHADQGSHYHWHMDYGIHNPRPRKISMTLQLTDPARYEGGELQFQAGHRTASAPRRRGALIAFPSFILHRVTPVTAGTRKSLVAWAAGPDFR